MIWVVLFCGGVLAGGILWWLLMETEGVYLGRRMVIWLYDRSARRYDRIKQFMPEYEQWLLAEPLMGMIAPQENPLVLDVATGTARLPLALLDNPYFHGRVIGIDLSREMLRTAAAKLPGRQTQANLICGPAESLPFSDNALDVVTCLEALEFMQHPAAVIAEMARVLRPGGLLLITNRINTRWMPGKIFTDEALHDLLAALDFDEVMTELWQVDYHRVWALKAGVSSPVGMRPFAEVLCCPYCGHTGFLPAATLLRCSTCTAVVPIGDDQVVEINKARPPDGTSEDGTGGFPGI